MDIEGITDITNTLYLVKVLYDVKRFDIVENFAYKYIISDENGLYDVYMETMTSIQTEIFDYYRNDHFEQWDTNLEVFSNADIEEYYILAGLYGEKHNLVEEDNPYIKRPRERVEQLFDFSYSVDCKIYEHTNPKRTFHSRIALYTSIQEWIELAGTAYGLVMMYKWFQDEVILLRTVMSQEAAA